MEGETKRKRNTHSRRRQFFERDREVGHSRESVWFTMFKESVMHGRERQQNKKNIRDSWRSDTSFRYAINKDRKLTTRDAQGARERERERVSK